MKKALNNLKNKKATNQVSEDDIETTHLYVRFLPKNDSELSSLKKDTSKVFFDFPLDYEIIKDGDSYHDSSIPDSLITWQYTVVSPNYIFPNIKYEILSELYMQEEESEIEITTSKKSISQNLWNDLEDEALKITGNYIEEKKWGSKWTPRGTITVYDNILNRQIPLEGVKVLIWNWFKYRSAHTNSNGYFSTSKFRRSVYYKIKWERSYWDIRDGYYSQAYYSRGGTHKSAWNLNIANNGYKVLRFAHIHREQCTDIFTKIT